jgi:hypothetical protein
VDLGEYPGGAAALRVHGPTAGARPDGPRQQRASIPTARRSGAGRRVGTSGPGGPAAWPARVRSSGLSRVTPGRRHWPDGEAWVCRVASRRCGPAASSPRATTRRMTGRGPKGRHMSQPADPISSPDAYRASLLAALGRTILPSHRPRPRRDPCPDRRRRRPAAHSPRAWRVVRPGVHRSHLRFGDGRVCPRALDPGRGRARYRRVRPGAVGRRAQAQRGRPSPAAGHFRGHPSVPTSTCGRGGRSRTVGASGATGSEDRRVTT